MLCRLMSVSYTHLDVYKRQISGTENIGTFVFDEIDTGISGKTASKVAEKMAYISDKQQIVCITHLPQIASCLLYTSRCV